jgi:hypothetical protein
MSIDGIGRPPIPKGGIGPVGSSGPTAATGEAFRVGAPEAAGKSAPSELLSRLERGEISVDAYVKARVDEAVRPFEGRLSGEQLQVMRDALSQQVETDPVVVELIRRATAGAKAMGESSG